MKKNKKINLYFILAGENLFHPHYLRGILRLLDNNFYHVVGITVAQDKYQQGFIDFVFKMIRLWGIVGFSMMVSLSIVRTVIDRIFSKGLRLKTIAEEYTIPYIESSNVNSVDHRKYLEEKNIDIIISSNGQIFRKELLNIPKIACINRHSALLPNYAGVLPVFWAMYHQEKQFGVTIHYMVGKVDEGGIILQQSMKRDKKKSLFANYMKAFDISIELTVQALKQVSKKQTKPLCDITYFSFPDSADLAKFRKNNTSIVLQDIKEYLHTMWN